MSFLFGADEVAKSQKAQIAATAKAQKASLKQIKPSKYTAGLDAESERLATTGFTPTSFTTPGYNINMGPNGGSLVRTADAQGWIDRLMSGGAATDASYGDLLSKLNAGFGRIGDASENSIRDSYAKQYGDLREQLSKRRVLGASFANSQLEAVKSQEARDVAMARADATQKELAMTSQVIEQQHNARMAVVNAGIQNSQYEGNIGATLSAQVSASMQNLSMARSDLAKLKASLSATGQNVAAGAVVNVNQPALSSYPQYGQMAAEAAAGPANFVGTLAGAALTGGFGGIGGLAAGAAGSAAGHAVGPGGAIGGTSPFSIFG